MQLVLGFTKVVLGFTKVCSARTYGAVFGGETRKPWMI